MAENISSERIMASVISQIEIAPRYFRLRFLAPHIAQRATAGQFVHILPRAHYTLDPLLRRAFSIMSTCGETFEILYRVEGRGTALMSQWNDGALVDVLGPLGNGFAALPTPPQRAILVGGGVGIPPMAMLASRCTANHALVALIGARSQEEVICVEDFAQYDVPVHIATDDGSVGHHGYVTELLKIELQTDKQAVVYACGPLPMLRAVARVCADFNVPCQVSLEENMPCGVGVCNGCVVPVANAGDDYERFRRICIQGPVLWTHEIDWSGFWHSGTL